MKDNQKIVAVVALGAVGWYLYTRSHGLTLTGQYANQAIPPNTRNALSLVTPSYSTSTAATNTGNPFAVLGTLINHVTSIFSSKAAPGNGPARSSSSAAIPNGNTGTSNPGVPAIAQTLPVYSPVYDDIDPFWGWGLTPTPIVGEDFSNTPRFPGAVNII